MNSLESSGNHPPASGPWKQCLSQSRFPAPKRLGTAALEESLIEVHFNEILISINPVWHSLDITVKFLSAGVRLLQPPSTPRALRFLTDAFWDDTPGVTRLFHSISLRFWNSVLTAGNYDALDEDVIPPSFPQMCGTDLKDMCRNVLKSKGLCYMEYNFGKG